VPQLAGAVRLVGATQRVPVPRLAGAVRLVGAMQRVPVRRLVGAMQRVPVPQLVGVNSRQRDAARQRDATRSGATSPRRRGAKSATGHSALRCTLISRALHRGHLARSARCATA
jgi:hypothetical protein